MNRWLYSIMILLLCLQFPLLAQKLDNFEDEVADSDDDSDEGTETTDIDVSFSGEIAPESVEAVIQVTGAALYGTYELLFHIPSPDRAFTEFGYADFPYADSYSGIFQTGNSKPFMFQTRMGYFYMNRDLTGYTFETIAAPHPYFSFQINYSRLEEKMVRTTDAMGILDFFINYNRIKDEKIALWWGAGVKNISGNSSHTGFAIDVGAEYFPVQPLSLSSRYNLGFIGGTTTDEFLITTGIHFNRLKLSVGYQSYRAGEITFSGMTAGIGLYF
jgi:hypothetical protein